MRALTIALCLLATPALADVAGVASVIDGDTIEVHGQRISLDEAVYSPGTHDRQTAIHLGHRRTLAAGV